MKAIAGLGDQAAVVGPTVWVRLGDDLVILTLSGIDDDTATARRIVDVMRPRMGSSAQASVRNHRVELAHQ